MLLNAFFLSYVLAARECYSLTCITIWLCFQIKIRWWSPFSSAALQILISRSRNYLDFFSCGNFLSCLGSRFQSLSSRENFRKCMWAFGIWGKVWPSRDCGQSSGLWNSNWRPEFWSTLLSSSYITLSASLISSVSIMSNPDLEGFSELFMTCFLSLN